jgi:hypothetical protein
MKELDHGIGAPVHRCALADTNVSTDTIVQSLPLWTSRLISHETLAGDGHHEPI